MSASIRWYAALGILAAVAAAGCAGERGEASAAGGPRNVILMIGDGMGFEQVRAAGLYAHGREGGLAMESLPHRAEMTTHPAAGARVVTDSAASGTALATGRKADLGAVSVAKPGDGRDLRTALEAFRDRGARTGLVTTTYLTHATPACFGAHAAKRDMTEEIAADYLRGSRPNVLMGGVREEGRGVTVEAAEAAGYAVVTTREAMEALDPAAEYVAGLFGEGHMPYEHDYATGTHAAYDTLPHLSEMTRAALKVLGRGGEGFFLMVEGGRIDHAGHANHLERNVFETLEFDRAVAVVLEWARGRRDTLVLVTADHECGGLRILEARGKGRMPAVEWATGGHTGVAVPLWAGGAGAKAVAGRLDNTDLYRLMTGESPGVEAAEEEAAEEEILVGGLGSQPAACAFK